MKACSATESKQLCTEKQLHGLIPIAYRNQERLQDQVGIILGTHDANQVALCCGEESKEQVVGGV